jgi:hypothetical protein
VLIGRWESRRQEAVAMGRYVILLAAPFIIGVVIAVGAVVLYELRERRLDARLGPLELDEPDDAPLTTESASEEASELTHRRIA